MQVKSIADCSKGSILSTSIKLHFVIKIFALSIYSGSFTQVLLQFKTHWQWQPVESLCCVLEQDRLSIAKN